MLIIGYMCGTMEHCVISVLSPLLFKYNTFTNITNITFRNIVVTTLLHS